MALLYRFSKLNDRSNTGIFTFIVTRSVTRDLHRDATTKDFYYGYHRWAISFTRANDKILGVYLILRDTSPSTTTYADFSITLLNREHFSRNEQYGEKQSKFTPEHSVHGINKWIPLSDIQTRNFGDETGEFLLELSLSNLMTVYETIICLQNSGNNQQSNNNANNNNNQTTATSTTSTTSSSSSSTTATATAASSAPATVQFKNGKLETSYFHYATFEWNLTIQTQNSGTSGAANMVRGLFKDTQNDSDIFSNTSTGAGAKSNRNYLIFLNRLTGFENSCRVQYRIVLGNDQLRDDSGMIEQISDMNGRSRGYQIDAQTFSQLTSLGMVNLYFEFYSCNPISEAKVSIQRSISPTINCYDRNKQGWSIESDMESENLKLKLYFMDMHSVPRNHLRYVSWYIYLIAQDQHGGASSNAITSGQTENIMVKNSPHYNYYIQDGIDMGVVMETDILVSDIKSSGKKYLENDNLTVHVEWYDSIMLFNHIYHKYDDIARMHCHQMRREIAALTKENYSLERQIFAYQRSISMANNQMNLQNNMSRLSISSPSKPNPPSLQQQSSTNLIGYNNTNTGSNAGSGAGGAGTGSNTPSSYRSTTQLDAINSNYYSPIVDDMNLSAAIAAAAAITGSRSNSYYDLNNPSTGTGLLVISRSEAINYSKERSATPVPSSPMQPSPVSNIAQQQQPLSNFLGSNLDQGIPTTITSRHSFSGPTSPHHHHHQQHIQQQQQYHEQPAYSSNLLQQQQYYQQQLQKQQHHHHHHHQLPQIPTSGVSYSPSTYRLRSPSSNPNIPQMYRDDVDPYGAAQLTSAAAAATNRMVNNVDDDGSIDDAYQTYSGRYKLTV